MVREGAQYWNDSAENYTEFEANFVIIDDLERADVVVRIVPSITTCGRYVTLDTYLGCADVYESVGAALYEDGPSVARITAGYQRQTTVKTISHEFGHLLGLKHEDADEVPVMVSSQTAPVLPQPNATERAWPWGEERSIEVYIDEGSAPEHLRDDYRREIQEVVEYYDAGADGFMPSNTSVSLTNNQTKADITVTFPETEPGREPGSVASVYGWDPDEDGALETYSNYTIDVEQDLDVDNSGWHVGYWLAEAFGAEPDDEKPDPFDTEYDDRDNWN